MSSNRAQLRDAPVPILQIRDNLVCLLQLPSSKTSAANKDAPPTFNQEIQLSLAGSVDRLARSRPGNGRCLFASSGQDPCRNRGQRAGADNRGWFGGGDLGAIHDSMGMGNPE